ncbi:MAG: radical SAM protein [Nanoarchaeota archaeon]
MRTRNTVKAIKGIFDYKLFNRRTPIAVSWLITNRCNFKCSYCNIWKYNQKEVTEKQALSLIDQLSEMNTQRLTIAGGEPLLRDDIGRIIKYSKDRNISTGVCTNGFLIEKKIDCLKYADMIHVSYDGPKCIHDKQIQEKTYKQVINGIRIAKEEGIKIWLTCVITKYNINKLNKIMSQIKRLNVHIYFRNVMTRPYSGNNENIKPSLAGYKDGIEFLLQEKKRCNLIVNSSFNLKQMLKWPISEKLKCYCKHLRSLIDCDGKVYPCDTLIRNKQALNYTKVGFKKAFDNIADIKCPEDMCACNSWDYPNMEFNNICSLNMNSIFNMFSLMNRQIFIFKSKPGKNENCIRINKIK